MRIHFPQSKSNSYEEDKHENSSYYPGCKKNANCYCEFCLASINATLDLKLNSSLTKLSSSKPNFHNHITPISFDSYSSFSTPRNSSQSIIPPSTPIIKSSAKSNYVQKMEKKKKKGQEKSFSGIGSLKVMFVLGFLLLADIVFSRVVSGIFQPSFSHDVVKRVGEKCHQVQDLNGKLRFLQKELGNIVHGKVSNCSFTDTSWEISQDGLLLNSRCKLYKSAIEEVTIWGWPLQTAGMITTSLSFRTLTILSGRVTEWNGGQVSYLIRKANTWILEYQRSSIVDGKGLYLKVLEFLQYRISRIIGKMKKDFWQFVAFEDNHIYNGFNANYGSKTPT